MLKLAVLISGTGSNLRALLEAASHPDFPARGVAVGADRDAEPDHHARAERPCERQEVEPDAGGDDRGHEVLGAGVGLCMQNLVLVVQNTAKPSEMGVASSGVAFFRSVGGTVGVSVMGAMLASKLLELFGTNAAALKKAAAAAGAKGREALEGLSTGTIPEVRLLPAGIREIVEDSYAQAIAFSFWIAVPLALIALIAIIVLPNVPLGHLTTSERLAEDEASLAAVSGNVSTTTGSIHLPDVADTAAATTAEPTEPQIHPATDAHAAGRSARSSS